ncbi:peptidylprolyl isomerase [Halarcobacter sp.]|uniref:FKBP-type peptidyl-prolyl cis-trans isomerase n=1 Tax=Halarcobacter sp. TaxID=2321133 RepID=UPI002AA7B339|nr:peptidylprolyl isomerase [Halarcobacter sp.]
MSKVIGFEYSLKDANSGEQLDSNVGAAPLEFVSGKGQIIAGLETKLVEMSENESADVMVQPADAYGEYNEEAMQTLPKEQFAGIELAEGMTLYGQGEQGETVQVTVKSFTDSDVTIDYNHPMAGKTLMFSVTIKSLRDATEEEIQTGVVGGMAAMGGCCGGGSHGESEGSCCSSEGGHDHGHSHGGGGCGCH